MVVNGLIMLLGVTGAVFIPIRSKKVFGLLSRAHEETSHCGHAECP